MTTRDSRTATVSGTFGKRKRPSASILRVAKETLTRIRAENKKRSPLPRKRYFILLALSLTARQNHRYH